MRFAPLVWLLWIGAAPLLWGQITYQQRQDLSYDHRIATLEAERATLKEDIKEAKTDITNLQNELKGVREQAKNADDLSKSNQGRIDVATTVGGWVGGGLVFLWGVIVTQWITRFMAAHRPRIIKP